MTEQQTGSGYEERARARLTELREIQSTLQQLAACGAVIAELEALLGERLPEGQSQ